MALRWELTGSNTEICAAFLGMTYQLVTCVAAATKYLAKIIDGRKSLFWLMNLGCADHHGGKPWL